jgi:8-oxo-dGTP pyrophosphatase MutT (NUDIX family)
MGTTRNTAPGAASSAARSTWDGLPISEERPFGITVVVYRRGARSPQGADEPAGPEGPKRSGSSEGLQELEVLLLHRAHHGPQYEGDWAWTPPSGARFPGEAVDSCARRELLEEAGLELEVRPTACGTDDWAVCVAEAPPGVAVSLAHDPEHDRYEWLPAGAAIARCRPEQVSAALGRAVALLRRTGAG